MEKVSTSVQTMVKAVLSFVLAFAMVPMFAAPAAYAAESIVYIDGQNGSDANGGQAQSPVKTIAQAQALAADDATLVVLGTVDVAQDINFKNQTISRGDGFSGPLVRINGGSVSFTGTSAKFDGKGADADAPLVVVESAKLAVDGVNFVGGHNAKVALEYSLPEGWDG